ISLPPRAPIKSHFSLISFSIANIFNLSCAAIFASLRAQQPKLQTTLPSPPVPTIPHKMRTRTTRRLQRQAYRVPMPSVVIEGRIPMICPTRGRNTLFGTNLPERQPGGQEHPTYYQHPSSGSGNIRNPPGGGINSFDGCMDTTLVDNRSEREHFRYYQHPSIGKGSSRNLSDGNINLSEGDMDMVFGPDAYERRDDSMQYATYYQHHSRGQKNIHNYSNSHEGPSSAKNHQSSTYKQAQYQAWSPTPEYDGSQQAVHSLHSLHHTTYSAHGYDVQNSSGSNSGPSHTRDLRPDTYTQYPAYAQSPSLSPPQYLEPSLNPEFESESSITKPNPDHPSDVLIFTPASLLIDLIQNGTGISAIDLEICPSIGPVTRENSVGLTEWMYAVEVKIDAPFGDLYLVKRDQIDELAGYQRGLEEEVLRLREVIRQQ
ncbi:hypothetical protein BDZ45DRAFT_785244, partial [Acephala macrosclerotiorum]